MGLIRRSTVQNEVVAVDEYRAFEYRWLYSSLDNMPSQPSVELYCYPDEWPPMYAQDENGASLFQFLLFVTSTGRYRS